MVPAQVDSITFHRKNLTYTDVFVAVSNDHLKEVIADEYEELFQEANRLYAH